MRDQRLIFFRCKTFAIDRNGSGGSNGILAREVASSISYYREKLAGAGLGRVLVRSVGTPFEEVAKKLAGLELKRVEPLDPTRGLEFGDGVRLDGETAQRIAPAIGAALGRAH